MANLKQIKSDTLGNISAVQTILERYPVLLTATSLKSINNKSNSFDFMFDVLRIIGVDNKALLEWASSIIVGNGTDGVLDVIETVVKTALKLNIKNVLTCTINPIIDDDLLDEHEISIPSNTNVEGAGIEIDLSSIDFNGILRVPPSDPSVGKYYYFDNNFTPSDMYKSTDFNAFLWYVVNKGIPVKNVGDEFYKMMWDNRLRNKKKVDNSFIDINSNFPKKLSPDQVKEYNEGGIPRKKQIIQCQYLERSYPLNNVLKIQLASSEYYHTRNVFNIGEDGNQKMNKTIFEFNNDFIDSIKLFDTKVLMAQIIDALTGSLVVSANYSINEIVIQACIGEIVKKIISADDSEIGDCYFTFSNEEYDRLVNEATLKYSEQYKINGMNESAIKIDPSAFLNSLSGITSGATLQENITAISNTFTEVSALLTQDGTVSVSDSFSSGLNIIYKMIERIIVSVIMAILSPKIMILLAINAHIMGNELPKSFDEIFSGLLNLFITIIRQIKDVILKELYKFLMKQLAPLIELFVSKIVLETIKFYKEILTNLINACFSTSSGGAGNGSGDGGAIDDVNYADIVPIENIPTQTC